MCKMNILISSCLLGLDCRYCGGGCADEKTIRLADRFGLIPVCPEQMGGLPTPRPPVELRNGRAVNHFGEDVTEAFQKGAAEVLKLAELFHCRCAVLKSRSPSCGSGLIYDGTFSGAFAQGDGITACLLRRSGILVLNEKNAEAKLARLLTSAGTSEKVGF